MEKEIGGCWLSAIFAQASPAHDRLPKCSICSLAVTGKSKNRSSVAAEKAMTIG